MYRSLSVCILLFLVIPALVLGCGGLGEPPAAPEEPPGEPPEEPGEEVTEDPAGPEEPRGEPGEDPAGPEEPEEVITQPWREANQLESHKTATLLIEGMEEEIELQLQVSSLYPYAIYLDQERYHQEEREGRDYITDRRETDFDVFMAIWHREGVEISALYPEIKAELQESYAGVQDLGWVEDPLPARKLFASEGDAWDSTVERYYLLEDFTDGVFVIQQKLFLEALEGHGRRFDGLLDELYLWNPHKGAFVQPQKHK